MEKKKINYSNIDIVITGNVAWDDSLSWDVKIMYGLIRGLCRNDFFCCYAANVFLSEQMNKSPRTVRTFLSELERAGYIVRDYAYIECNDGRIRRKRAIVPKDLYDKFLNIRAEMEDAKNEASKNMSSKGGEKLPPVGGEKLPPSKLKELPYKNNISTNIEVGINPQPPDRGLKEATLFDVEQEEVLGKFGNVRLTQSQKAAFKGEFGTELSLALIEQLDAYIQSDGRKKRRYAKKTTSEVYATLRDWALRRREPEPTRRILIGGRDLERRLYTDQEIEALYNIIDDDEEDDGET